MAAQPASARAALVRATFASHPGMPPTLRACTLQTLPCQVRAGVRDLKKAQSLGFALDPSGIELVACDVVKQTPA